MSDTLEVFGTEYSNVTGIKATDNNGDIQTYIKPEGTINITTKGLTDVTAYRTANVDTGTSVPDGGSTNQVLAKDSNTDGDVTWKTVDKTYVGLGNVDNTSDANKPISTATQTALNGKLSTSLKGANSGLAELDANGKVPTSQLPSFVDDVLEYSAQSSFPATGETGKIYIAQDTNKTYRWSGTAYVEISSSLALGTTSSTAYRGDYGNTAYTHATDSSRSTTAQASGLYKIATTAEGHVASVTAVVKSDITNLGIPAQDTTNIESMTGTLPIANGGTGKTTAAAAANALIGGLSTWTATPTDDTYFIRQDTSGGLSFGRVKFSTLWTYIKNKISSVLGLTATTYGGSAAQVNGHTVAVDVPSDAVFTDTVYTHPTTSGNKHIPSGGSSGQILKYSADGTAQWANETAELPSGGSNGQLLQKTASGAGWTTITGVPTNVDGRMSYLVRESGSPYYVPTFVELTMGEDENQNFYFDIYNIDEVWNAYLDNRRVLIWYWDSLGNQEDNYYIMTGLCRFLDNDDNDAYLMQIERLNVDGTLTKKQFLLEYDDNDGYYHGTEQTIPAGSSVQSAAGVSF